MNLANDIEFLGDDTISNIDLEIDLYLSHCADTCDNPECEYCLDEI